MKQITQTLIINYGKYEKGQFMPIWSGDELLNANEFIAYKIKSKLRRAGHRLALALQASRA